jgi:putative methionine-R-sulfoxide reductase with GAF domain
MPASVIVLFRYDTASDTLIAAESFGDEQALLRGFAIRTGERITGWSAANNRTSVNSDAHLDLGTLADTFEPRLKSAISTPLTDDGRLVSVLSAYASKTDAFSKAHGYIIEHVASLLLGHAKAQVSRHPSERVVALKAVPR